MTDLVDAEPERDNRTSIFVHDFVPLDVPLDEAAEAAFALLDAALIASFVATACNREASRELDAIGHRPVRDADLVVTIDPPRNRVDAVIVPISWQAVDPSVAVPLDADIEIAAYGRNRCHVHLLGRTRLKPGIRPISAEASLYGRLSVAVVRHVLDQLAHHLQEKVRS